MFNLIYDKNISKKISLEVPIRFGVEKGEDCTLFSYSIYENRKIREVRFNERIVVNYNFDNSLFLHSREVFDEFGTFVTGEKYELKEESDSILRFREYDKYSNVGNIGTIKKNENGEMSLSWHRVDSYMGYKVKATFHGESLGQILKEEYYRFDLPVETLTKVLKNQIKYKNCDLDLISKEILFKRWPSENELQPLLKSLF